MIYIVLHKPYKIPKIPFYIPIRVGNANFSSNIIINDECGDTIHHKNSSYSELTALYWIWKNTTDDIKGIMHYRRYFLRSRHYIWPILSRFMFSEKEIKKILEFHDIIVPKSLPKNLTLKTEYGNVHNISDFLLLREVVLELHPEYLKSFDLITNSNQNQFRFYYGMFIAHSKIFDEYSDWLFSILFSLESQLDINHYDDYQKRVYGFLSERLINVFIHHNNLSFKELNVVHLEVSLLQHFKSFLYRILIKIGIHKQFLIVYKFFRKSVR